MEGNRAGQTCPGAARDGRKSPTFQTVGKLAMGAGQHRSERRGIPWRTLCCEINASSVSGRTCSRINPAMNRWV